MHEQPSPEYGESFAALQASQQLWEQVGYFLQPVTREHIEGGVTSPLLHRLHTLITKRGFAKVAGHTLLSFSGYAEDEREIIVIPEIRAYYQQLNQELPELPALPAYLPEARYNGPGFHVMLLGTIEETFLQPELELYDIRVAEARPLVEDALVRIQRAAQRYHLQPRLTQRLLTNFTAGATQRYRP